MAMRRISPRGVDLLKSFEGFRPKAVALGEDQWIIGYSHIETAKEGLAVSEEDATKILQEYDLPPVEELVDEETLAPLTQNEFDALVSFAFNIGTEAFRQSQVLALINSGNKLAATTAMMAWRRADVNGRVIVVDALVRRRAREAALFLKVDEGVPASPTALITPIQDEYIATAVSQERAVTVDTNFTTGQAEMIPAAIEEASEAVGHDVAKRLTRILGEPKGANGNGEISAAEIAAAVSTLADQDAVAAKPVIDDLAPLDLPLDENGHAIVKPLVPDLRRPDVSLGLWAPFALICVLGALLFGIGVISLSGWLAGGESSLDSRVLGPFLSILGGFLTLGGGYYLYKSTQFSKE